MSIYDFKAKLNNNEEKSLSDFKNKVLLIVNTASKCGFTPQYEGLEKLYQKYKDDGLVILGFPCNQFLEQDPASDDEIKEFCKINYGVSFPLFAKIDVNGENSHPLFTYLKENGPDHGFEDNKKMSSKLKEILVEHYPSYLENSEIRWNFTKFLVDRDGKIVERFEPTVEPEEMEAEIKSLL